MKVGICDDEDKVLAEMGQIIERYAAEMKIQTDILEYYDGKELLYAIEEDHEQFDIIFMDIEMNCLDGIETAAKVREKDRYVLLVFITSHDKYALKAYQVHPFHFLVKPLKQNMVEKCFMDAYRFFSTGESYYTFKQRKAVCQVPLNDIMYFKSEKRIVKIFMKNGDIYSYYDKLDNVQRSLESSIADFWWIHKSVLVNSDYIFRKAYDYVELKNGKILSISQERNRELNANYIRLLQKKRNGACL